MAQFSALGLFALMAGFFYAFSVCVMPGLDRISPSMAIEAMQAINAAVRNPVFFMTFFLTPLVAIIAAGLTYLSDGKRAAIFMGLATGIYVLLAQLLTVSVNVPMNEALAVVDPATTQAHTLWRDYSTLWTRWNTVRTITSLVAMLVFAGAMISMRNNSARLIQSAPF